MENQSSAKKNSNLLLCRIFQIDRIIREGAYPTKSKLAELCGVSERTIARDLEHLRNDFNAPLQFDTEKNGFYCTENGFSIKYINLTEGELFYVALFDQLLTKYRNTPIENQLKSIFQKIIQSLPQNVQIDSKFLSKDITYISEYLPTLDKDIFELIFKMLRLKHQVKIVYKSLSNPQTSRIIDPLHIVCKNTAWYIIAYCHKAKAIRTFLMTRIVRAEDTGKCFIYPKDFKIENYIDTNFGVWHDSTQKFTVHLRCRGPIANLALERIWHNNQKTILNDDGTVDIFFETTQFLEAYHLVMSFGPDAMVLEPLNLANYIKNEAQRIADNYADIPNS